MQSWRSIAFKTGKELIEKANIMQANYILFQFIIDLAWYASVSKSTLARTETNLIHVAELRDLIVFTWMTSTKIKWSLKL